MTANIIGLGPTGGQWDGNGFSIGVNDAYRWGNPTDHLLVLNGFGSQPDRKKIIEQSIPDVFWAHLAQWESQPNFRKITMQPWKGMFVPGKVYYSNNSPFVAVTLAYQLGYRKIVLWGVDFTDHGTIKNDLLKQTIKDFNELQAELIKNGSSIYLGAKGSVLDLEMWDGLD